MNKKFFQFLSICNKAGKLWGGYNKSEEKIKKKEAYLILLSKESSSNTTKKFENYANKYNIEMIEGLSKYDMGKTLGKQEINVIVITDKNLGDKLISLNAENENSGVK